MDPITLVTTALAAGAALGLKDTATGAVADAYAGLKRLVRKRLATRSDGELVLARHAEAPAIWNAPLAAELNSVHADQDQDLIKAAQTLMRLMDEPGFRSGKYHVEIQQARGLQIGHHNTQHNTFAADSEIK
jgi:hypothetical protein